MTNFDENVLVFLDEEGKATSAVIAERLKCSPEEAAEACDRLQERRLVHQVCRGTASLGDSDPSHTKESSTTCHLTDKGKSKAADLWPRIKQQPAVGEIDEVVQAVAQCKAAGHGVTTLGDVVQILGTDDFLEVERRLNDTGIFVVYDPSSQLSSRTRKVKQEPADARWLVQLSPKGVLRAEHLECNSQRERRANEHHERQLELRRLELFSEKEKQNADRQHKEEQQRRDHKHQSKLTWRNVLALIGAAILSAILMYFVQARLARSKNGQPPASLPASQPAEPNPSASADRQVGDGA